MTAEPEATPPARFSVSPTGGLIGEDGLTVKERLFVAEIQVDWNMTQAAIRAGYSKHSANDIGREMMRKPKIEAAIAEAMEHRVKKAGVNASWVLGKLVDVHTKAERIEGLGALDRRLKSLELIGRHVDVAAFRGTGGFRPIGEGPPREWDLSLLDDEELKVFERLLAKITSEGSTDDGTRPGGNGGASDEGRPGVDPA